jgi:hypothetical protein
MGPERVSAEPRKARFFAKQKMRPKCYESYGPVSLKQEVRILSLSGLAGHTAQKAKKQMTRDERKKLAALKAELAARGNADTAAIPSGIWKRQLPNWRKNKWQD